MSYSIFKISLIKVTYENYGYDRLDSKFRNKKHRILLVEFLGRQPNEDGGRDCKYNIQMDCIKKVVMMRGRHNWLWVMSHGML